MDGKASPFICVPLQSWDWRLVGDRKYPGLASIVVLTPDDLRKRTHVVAMSPSCCEEATDYACFDLKPRARYGLELSLSDALGRCTNEPEGAGEGVLDRDFATLAKDAFAMATASLDVNPGRALVIGFAPDLQPDETHEYLAELLESFVSLTGEEGESSFWKSITMGLEVDSLRT